MTPKQTALLRVAMFFIVAMVGGVGVSLIFTYFTPTQIGIGFVAFMLVYASKMLFDMELERAERLEKLNKSVDKA